MGGLGAGVGAEILSGGFDDGGGAKVSGLAGGDGAGSFNDSCSALCSSGCNSSSSS
ncbi:hypothetical protein A2U01_0062756, partial [Trifolium medium]|nr:hypothetical protein [Trifolium medium]